LSLDRFHPVVRDWFQGRFREPTPCQRRAWPAILENRHTLIAAPTGSGKTLAAFLAAIDTLVRKAERGQLGDRTEIVYVSPLKALSNDVERNLQEPLQGIQSLLREGYGVEATIRAFVRTGDTPSRDRVAMRKHPPHILVTTPESLYILLTSVGGRDMLRSARTVIIDEIHALFSNKRGAHLALSLARLDALAGLPLTRIGLSATQRPIDEVARFLAGCDANANRQCTIIDMGHERAWDLGIEIPASPLSAVMSNEVWEEVYARLAALITEHRTTLVFVNTRRMAERVARHLSERLGTDAITAHHGSMAREHRLEAEQRLKAGALRALVATASLELGIDVGDVDLVCQLSSPRSIAGLLQRVGRSGHALSALPKGRLFPLSRDDLVECAALLEAVRRGDLDQGKVPPGPLDVLAQQIVAMVANEDWDEDQLYDLVLRTYPYRALARAEFQQLVRMLSEGFTTRRGRRGAYLHRDTVQRRLRARRGSRLVAVTCGGAIPDNADYEVRQEPAGTFVGTVNEDFAIESLAGDIFQLGNTSWRILRVETGIVRVEDARGQPPTIPFWLGEAPGRTAALSQAVSRLRALLDQMLVESGIEEAVRWLRLHCGLTEPATLQLAEYLASARAALGVLPTQETLVLERFFDESGGMQLVLHSAFGARLNRAFGLALRKRFCAKFNFELQAAATEDAVVLSLGETHSFPLSDVWGYLNAASIREVLTQALLDAPMFTLRWRWNASISLAVPRAQGGRKVPPRLHRMRAEDLLALVFPDQVACLEHLSGRREIPDHPLVRQTLSDCLTDAMDIDGLEALLKTIEAGRIRLLARDLTEPSPLAQEILNARPYAFLDDAPLEERRTQAILSRRWLDIESAERLGRLDPGAIERVCAEAWPDASTADELHEALTSAGFFTELEGRRGAAGEAANAGDWGLLLEQLTLERRATVLCLGEWRAWVAVERLPELLALHPSAAATPILQVPADYASKAWTAEDALVELLRSRLEVLGPTTAAALALEFGLAEPTLRTALLTLESQGYVLRGDFTGQDREEWCERRLLARIHRYTVQRLRQEIEPVAATDFLRFLFRWQHVDPATRLSGEPALPAVLERLEGFEAAAASWEEELLPARLRDYDPAWIDCLCLSGRLAWRRRPAAPPAGNAAGPLRSTPITFLARQREWPAEPADSGSIELSPHAEAVAESLRRQGALFTEDLIAELGYLKTQVEQALAELVVKGIVSCDSFAGLRLLLAPASGRYRRSRRRGWVHDHAAGRWVLVQKRLRTAPAPDPLLTQDPTGALEACAWILLRRYGVVFRRLTLREPSLPPWRDLVRVYRRLEARGEIRGGRFVDAMSGEQYALPEAVGLLREVRREEKTGSLIAVSGADPLNLAGIITPGERVPALTSYRILYLDGQPIATLQGKEVQFATDPDPANAWELRNALIRRPTAAQLE